MNPIAIYALLFAVSFGLSRAGALLGMRLGQRAGAMSEVNHRSSHTRPTSRLGGIGIAAGFLGYFVALLFVIPIIATRCLPPPMDSALPPALFGTALVAFVVGLADDLWNIPPLPKMAGQVAAVLPLALVPILHRGGVVYGLTAPIEAFVVAAFALFFINAFNFMDGMDGFAALFAAIAAVSISIANWPEEADRSPTLAAFFLPVLAGSAMGFFSVNRPPARVFMGDGGSHLLGALLGAQLLVASRAGYRSGREHGSNHGDAPDLERVAAVLIVLLPFIFDVTLTLIRRFRRGENLFQAHRSHLYQRLMICGMSHAEVLKLNARYFVFCGALGATAGALSDRLDKAVDWPAGLALHALAFALALAAMLQYWRLVLRRESGRAAAMARES